MINRANREGRERAFSWLLMFQRLAESRRFVATVLAIAGFVYLALVCITYGKITAPSSLAPDLQELQRLLFDAATPISAMERRLAASDTPLGTGPLITSGTSMTSPFVGPSLTLEELAQRDGERLALLDWIRSGASRGAYDRDDYKLSKSTALAAITPEFIIPEKSLANDAAHPRVRIRSIIDRRCVNCHHDDGDDTARLIPFDSYRSIALYLRPETHADGARPWLLAALYSLFPMATLVGVSLAYTKRSR